MFCFAFTKVTNNPLPMVLMHKPRVVETSRGFNKEKFQFKITENCYG